MASRRTEVTTQTEELIRAALKDGCRAHCDSLIDELRRLSAVEHQRGELLEALNDILNGHGDPDIPEAALVKARAAIARAEGEV
jgi:hypothetical protein